MTATESAVAALVGAIRAEIREDMTRQPKLLLNVGESAEQLSIGRTHLYQLLDSGAIPSRLIGRRRLIAAVDLQAYANTNNKN